ncbi:MAG: hypothetical protein ACR2M7_01660, partial [Bdellovibrionales bacterium]
LGYSYAVKNYFSKRRNNSFSHKGSARNFILYIESSFYRENRNKILFPISSFSIGFHQRMKEILGVGDFEAQIAIQSIKLAAQRGNGVEINYRFTIPDVRSGFPFYFGVGTGFSMFPRRILKNATQKGTLNTQTFAGVRLVDIYYNVGFMGEVRLKLTRTVDKSKDVQRYLEAFAVLGLVFSF